MNLLFIFIIWILVLYYIWKGQNAPKWIQPGILLVMSGWLATVLMSESQQSRFLIWYTINMIILLMLFSYLRTSL